MRWPWQKRPLNPVDDVIAERLADSRATLKRAGAVMVEARTDITDRLVADYERADRERRS